MSATRRGWWQGWPTWLAAVTLLVMCGPGHASEPLPRLFLGVDGGRAVLEAFELPPSPASPPDPCTLELVLSPTGIQRVTRLGCDEALADILVPRAETWRFTDVVLPEGATELRLLASVYLDPWWPERGQLHLVDGSERVRPSQSDSPPEVPPVTADPRHPQPPHDGSEAWRVDWSEIHVKKRVPPTMPEEAKQLNIAEERCHVRFFIDERGVPYDIQLEKCPSIYREGALEASWKWRFYPLRIDGKPVKAQFVLVIVYRLTG
jgi:hypothetical protein